MSKRYQNANFIIAHPRRLWLVHILRGIKFCGAVKILICLEYVKMCLMTLLRQSRSAYEVSHP